MVKVTTLHSNGMNILTYDEIDVEEMMSKKDWKKFLKNKKVVVAEEDGTKRIYEVF